MRVRVILHLACGHRAAWLHSSVEAPGPWLNFIQQQGGRRQSRLEDQRPAASRGRQTTRAADVCPRPGRAKRSWSASELRCICVVGPRSGALQWVADNPSAESERRNARTTNAGSQRGTKYSTLQSTPRRPSQRHSQRPGRAHLGCSPRRGCRAGERCDYKVSPFTPCLLRAASQLGELRRSGGRRGLTAQPLIG
jgi:hypothetical protein